MTAFDHMDAREKFTYREDRQLASERRRERLEKVPPSDEQVKEVLDSRENKK